MARSYRLFIRHIRTDHVKWIQMSLSMQSRFKTRFIAARTMISGKHLVKKTKTWFKKQNKKQNKRNQKKKNRKEAHAKQRKRCKKSCKPARLPIACFQFYNCGSSRVYIFDWPATKNATWFWIQKPRRRCSICNFFCQWLEFQVF